MRASLFGTLAGGGAAIDPDAQAFITAAGIVDATQITAINDWFVGAKAAGIYSLFDGVWMWVGSTELACSLNAVDPRDLDAAYRLTFHGGFTFDANGITPDGIAGTYADTHLNGSTVLSKTDSHYSLYCRTNSADTTFMGEFGANAYCMLSLRTYDTIYQNVPTGSDLITTGNTNSQGFYVGNFTASDDVLYKNGSSLVAKGSAAGTDYANAVMVFCNGNSLTGPPSNRNLAFGSIGKSMTPTQITDFTTLVAAFQTTLGRNV